MSREEVLKLIEDSTEKLSPKSSYDSTTIDSYWETLQRDGVIVIEDLFTAEEVDTLNNVQKGIFDHITKLVSDGEIQETKITWIAESDQVQYLKKKSYDYDGIVIIYLGKGRYDFQWGFNKGIFERPEFYFPSPIKELMIRGLVKDFHKIAGSLPLEPQSNEGDWHRDTLPLFIDNNLNLSLPPWYYTVLIPLVDVTHHNGATEFIIGSHKCPSFEESLSKLPRKQLEVKKGSGVLLDGRLFHRGMPNESNEIRPMLYVSYSKNWYRTYHTGPVIL